MPQLNTPKGIRQLLRQDPARVSDVQLLAMLLGRGSTRVAGEHGEKISWTAVALAEDLHATAGWGWAELVRRGLCDRLEWSSFGIGASLRAPLLATMGLARRWRRGFEAGDADLRPEELKRLISCASARYRHATVAELMCVTPRSRSTRRSTTT